MVDETAGSSAQHYLATGARPEGSRGLTDGLVHLLTCVLRLAAGPEANTEHAGKDCIMCGMSVNGE